MQGCARARVGIKLCMIATRRRGVAPEDLYHPCLFSLGRLVCSRLALKSRSLSFLALRPARVFDSCLRHASEALAPPGDGSSLGRGGIGGDVPSGGGNEVRKVKRRRAGRARALIPEGLGRGARHQRGPRLRCRQSPGALCRQTRAQRNGPLQASLAEVHPRALKCAAVSAYLLRQIAPPLLVRFPWLTLPTPVIYSRFQ